MGEKRGGEVGRLYNILVFIKALWQTLPSNQCIKNSADTRNRPLWLCMDKVSQLPRVAATAS